MIKIGTNRLVFIGKKFVYKIPKNLRGIRANLLEYNLSKNKCFVAKTYKKWYGLKQEKLYNTIIFPLYFKPDCRFNKEIYLLYSHKLNNRLQIGKSLDGKYKIFDYEDIKYYK